MEEGFGEAGARLKPINTETEEPTMSEKELKEMMELEDYAHFRAELVEISPQSFDIDELREILDDMIRSKVAMENDMRDSFAELGEVEQTKLLDSLGQSGYKDRDWWYRMLMDGPRHRDSRPSSDWRPRIQPTGCGGVPVYSFVKCREVTLRSKNAPSGRIITPCSNEGSRR